MRIAVSVLLALFLGSCAAPNPEKPNIVLINADDLGWMDVGFNGSSYYETPHLDQLASEGMVFTQAYASASNCAPSRACMMSGQWAPRHGIFTVGNPDRGKAKDRKLIPIANNVTLGDPFFLLPEALKELGYTTVHAGKWHLGPDPRTQGFDVNIGGSHAGHPSSYYPPYKNVNLDAPNGDDYLTVRIMDEILSVLDSLEKEPFFLYYAPYAVHSPIQPVPDLLPKYQAKQGNEAQHNSNYASMVENLDIQIGRLLVKLEESGAMDQSLIIFTSDNGGVYNISKQWPLRAGKGSYYEGGIREPLIVSWKGHIAAGSRCDYPVSNLDFYPTLLDLLGQPASASLKLDGQSFWPLLAGKKELDERPLFWHFPFYLEGGNEESQDTVFRTRPGSAVRLGRYKLIEYFENQDIELYDLQEDPGEKNNIAQSEPDKTAELLLALRKWREQTDAPVPDQLNPLWRK